MNFAYMLGVLMYLPVWLILYLHRRDLRREILVMGVLAGLAGILLEAFVWTKDWWQPQTLTGTVVGLEDFLLGFLVGGIVVSIYEEIFRERLVKIRKKDHHVKYFLIVMLLSVTIGSFSFFYLRLHSFYASMLGMIIPALVIYFFRKDLIILSLTSGLMIVLVSIPVYCIGFWFYPDAINFWAHQNISGVLILGIPVEDLIWFFGVGMFWAPLYEFWKGERLQKLSK